jgi:hypothetical protein
MRLLRAHAKFHGHGPRALGQHHALQSKVHACGLVNLRFVNFFHVDQPQTASIYNTRASAAQMPTRPASRSTATTPEAADQLRPSYGAHTVEILHYLIDTNHT